MTKLRVLIDRLIRNGSASVIAETTITTALLLITFRIIIRTSHFETFGVWALLQSLATMVRMVDVGIGGSLSRYIGQINYRLERELTWKYIDTGILFNAAFFASLVTLAYLPLRLAIHVAVPTAQESVAAGALPFVLLNLVLTSIAQVPVAALIGVRQPTAKSAANILGAASLLIFTVALVGPFGLTGLIFAQVLQQLVILVSAWTMLSFTMEGRGKVRLKLSFHPAIVRQTASVSLGIQANGLVASLVDVVIKFTLTRWGGTAATGMYELASRFVNVVRSLLVTPTNLAIPPMALALARGRRRVVARIYGRQMRLLVVAGVAFYGLALLSAPIISLIVLGGISNIFLLYFIAQWSASIANVLSAPSSAIGVAAGNSKANMIGSCTMVIGCLVLGNAFGYLYGTMAALAAVTLMVAVGSMVSTALNCRTYGVAPLPSFRRGASGRFTVRGIFSPILS